MAVEQNDSSSEPHEQEDGAEAPVTTEESGADTTSPPAEATEAEPVAESDEVETLRQQISVLEQRASEATDKMLRSQAELDNVRKRATRDIENAHKYALDKFLAELLPVIDSLELGVNAAGDSEEVSGLVEGMNLTLKKFADVLEKFGVSIVDPQGEKFNPEQHEAVSMQSQDGLEAGMVISVMQKGYELNGRLIRPAMVMVSN